MPRSSPEVAPGGLFLLCVRQKGALRERRVGREGRIVMWDLLLD